MNKFKLLSAAAAVFAAPVAGYAQEITTQIQGSVVAQTGEPVAGATVTITDTRTGANRTISAGADGQFSVVGLTPGGPYIVTAEAPGFQGQTVNDVATSLQGATTLQFTLDPAATAAGGGETIVVTAQRANVQLRAIGPGQAFGEQALEDFPSITRDIRDIIRLDPRVSLDRSGDEVDRISCLGGNDRANTFSVDGIVQADVFGLNGTPFAGRNALPLPFDAIRQTSVEFAPFDVEYGQFTGCAVNVVTRSGENQFHGSAFFTYRNENLVGDTVDGETLTIDAFEDKRWGATFSGPIIRDTLFFFVGYEQTEQGDVQDRGPVDGGFAQGLPFVTVAQFNEFSQILSDVYGIETGGIARALPQSDRRFFGRIDWLLSDRHRFEGSYQRLEETNVEPDDVNNSNLAGLNTFEDEGTISNYYSARFYSDWTDNFSTQLRGSYSQVQDVQGPVGGGEAQSDNPIPRIIVGVQNGSAIGTLQAGPGFFRTANELFTEILQLKATANYRAGSHNITVGAEYNDVSVFNLFAPNATGTLIFSSIENLRQGILTCGTNTFPNASQVRAGNNPARCGASGTQSVPAGAFGNSTASGDINDAAAAFSRQIYTFYVQDEWQATPQLTVLAGLRIDWLDGDAPTENPNFEERYGFTNRVPFSAFDPVLLPRLALTYDFQNEGFLRSTQVRGGVGIFSGGDPTVYFSNAFSNNGFNVGLGRTGTSSCFPTGGAPADVVQNGQFTGVPQCVTAAGGTEAGRGLARTQSTNPDFQNPTVIRANFGLTTRFGFGGGFFDNWALTLDYIYSRFEDPINFVDLAQIPDFRTGVNGFTVDGRPIYRSIDPTAAGCTAELIGTGGTPPRYTNVNSACFNTSRDDEIQLTNGPAYDSHVASVILSKSFQQGVFTPGGGVSLNIGYAFTDARNNRFNASSTATSSYDIVAAFDRQNPAIATSEYQTRHNFTFAASFREQFFADYDTQFGLVFIARSGRPYSLTFNNGGVFSDPASGSDNALLYIPTGPTDPNISPAVFNAAGVRTGGSDPAAVAALVEYANSLSCARDFIGRSITRNTCRNDWFYDLDLRFSQEIPGPGRLVGLEDKITLFANFDNFLNIIDSNANTFRNRDYAVEIADGGVDAQGRYIITNFNPQDEEIERFSSSVWRIQLGVRYEF